MKQPNPEPGSGTSSAGLPSRTPAVASLLVSELTGSLPCVRCRYDLKGLSIRALCPECGTPVRATLLAVVDPKASELQPIDRPHWVGIGLLLWSVGGMLAVLAGWGLWAIELAASEEFNRFLPWAQWAVILMTAVSGLGAASLIRPHTGIRPFWKRLAITGVLLYLPLVAAVWHLVIVEWESSSFDTLGRWAATSDTRSVLGLAVQGLIIAVVCCLRPNARLLASRSVLMREGRVDRQTLRALVAVLSVSIVGGIVSVVAGRMQPAETALLVGQLMVLVGAALFTVGLAGVVVDCWRIHKVVLQPPLSLEALFEEPSSTDPVERHA